MRIALGTRALVRKDPVLVIAIVLALASCAVVPPDAAYADYVDLRTIGMLFSLMTIMTGLSRLGVFRIACRKLLGVVRGPRCCVPIGCLRRRCATWAAGPRKRCADGPNCIAR